MEKKIYGSLILCSFFSIFCFCSMAQNVGNAQTLLWKISGNGLKEESYLLITTTLTCEPKINFDAKITSALIKVKEIVFESAVSDKKNETKLASLIQLKNDSLSAKNSLSPSVYLQLKQKAEEMGVNELFLNEYALWYITARLLTASAECNIPNPDKMEMALREFSKNKGTPINYLLNIETSIGVYDKYPKNYTEKFISYLLGNPDKMKAEVERKNVLYRQGDFAGLKLIVAKSEISKIRYSYNSIEMDRMNTLYLRIKDVIKSGSALITIDAVDIANDTTSIFNLLTKNGFTVSSVLN